VPQALPTTDGQGEFNKYESKISLKENSDSNHQKIIKEKEVGKFPPGSMGSIFSSFSFSKQS